MYVDLRVIILILAALSALWIVLPILKRRLAHVSYDSWHFKLTQAIWKEKTYGKACSYYWYKVPIAMFRYTVSVVSSVSLLIFFLLIILSGVIFGFYWQKVDDGYSLGDYKVLPNGKKSKVAIWEIALAAALLYAIYHLAFVAPSTGIIFAIIGLIFGLCLVAVFAFTHIISKIRPDGIISQTKQHILQGWNRLCPDLEVEGKPITTE